MFEECDLTSTISPGSVDRIIVDIPDDADGNQRVAAFFRKAWAAFPEGRNLLLNYARRDSIWQMSEIYDYAREAIIPRKPSPASIVDWYPFLPLNRGTISTEIVPSVAAQLIDLAASRVQLDQLADEIASARKEIPNWTPGDVLLAMVQCRAGRYGEVKRLVPQVLEGIKKDPIAAQGSYAWYAEWAMASELEKHDATRELAVTVYQASLDSPYGFLQFRFDQEKIPVRRLIGLYVSDGRNDEARHALLKISSQDRFPDAYPEDMIKLYRALRLFRIAPLLLELGYGGDAAPAFAQAIQLVEEHPSIPATYFPNPEQVPRQLRDGLKAALDGLSPVELTPIAGRLVSDAIEARNPAARGDRAKPRDQALDLVTLVYPRELEHAQLRSLMAESLAACDEKQLAALDGPLETLRKSHPEDFSVAIAIALKALASGDSKPIAAALEALSRLVDQTPLEPLPPGGRANADNAPRLCARSRSGWSRRACGKASARERPAGHGRPPGHARPPGRSSTVRQPRAPGHAPRAGRARAVPRRPESRRGRLGPDARHGPSRRAGAGSTGKTARRRTGPAQVGIGYAPHAIAGRRGPKARGTMTSVDHARVHVRSCRALSSDSFFAGPRDGHPRHVRTTFPTAPLYHFSNSAYNGSK